MADSETQQVDVKKLVTESIIEDASARLVALEKRGAEAKRKAEAIIEYASASLVASAKRRAEAELKAERKAILTTVGVLIAASLLWF